MMIHGCTLVNLVNNHAADKFRIGPHSVSIIVRLNGGHGVEVKLGMCKYERKPGSFALL